MYLLSYIFVSRYVPRTRRILCPHSVVVCAVRQAGHVLVPIGHAGNIGHVDILQVRNGLIHILDFKPDAEKEGEQKVASQLFFYASGLSFRAKIPLGMFRCAWFDDKVYFEFCPKDASIKFENSKWRSH